MKTYGSKDELKAEIQKSLDRYLAEFDAIPESRKDVRVPDADRTPAENLAYQVGWTTLLLQWEADEQHGRAAKTAVWPVYKFIHVNTVAPFGTFRTKIRKWKKAAL